MYGQRADSRNGIYRMLHEAVEKHSITYHGSGEAIREYIHVEDAARMSVQVLEPERELRLVAALEQVELAQPEQLVLAREQVPEK